MLLLLSVLLLQSYPEVMAVGFVLSSGYDDPCSSKGWVC
jgi:hypothetical protein